MPSSEINWANKLERQLKQMEKGAQLSKKIDQIPYLELLTPSFMLNNTSFSSIEEMLVAGGFKVKSQTDFESILGEEFDKYIGETTLFLRWEEMLGEAKLEYVKQMLI